MKLLENYFFMPVASWIVGAVMGLLLPIIVKKYRAWRKHRIEKSIQGLNIEGTWTSVFLEETSLYNEEVTIEQTGQSVTATIKLNKRTYFLTGEFKNQILVGTYVSKNKRKDERGTICLRLINENLLSGYCTFIYKNKQVYSSPYVLISNNSYRPDKGTYQFCNSCVGKFDCCCNCEKIDMPILLPFEAQKIAISTRMKIEDFCEKKTQNLYQMRRVDDDPDKGCVFFQNNRCSIYSDRPIDCRLFPFDFKEINGEYWLIYYDQVCNAVPTNFDELSVCGHCLRPLLELIMPYVSECSDPILCKRLNNQHYNKLFPISSIRDDKFDR